MTNKEQIRKEFLEKFGTPISSGLVAFDNQNIKDQIDWWLDQMDQREKILIENINKEILQIHNDKDDEKLIWNQALNRCLEIINSL